MALENVIVDIWICGATEQQREINPSKWWYRFHRTKRKHISYKLQCLRFCRCGHCPSPCQPDLAAKSTCPTINFQHQRQWRFVCTLCLYFVSDGR